MVVSQLFEVPSRHLIIYLIKQWQVQQFLHIFSTNLRPNYFNITAETKNRIIREHIKTPILKWKNSIAFSRSNYIV